jgi:hypothetical protein
MEYVACTLFGVLIGAYVYRCGYLSGAEHAADLIDMGRSGG